MVREGSFSPNRKETRAYLIRDLQMECDCELLEIMRVKIYMLIPKLIKLGNTVREKDSVRIMNQEPWELFPGAYCVATEEPCWIDLYKQWELTAPCRSLKQVNAPCLSKSALRLWLCNLPGSSNACNTRLLTSFKKHNYFPEQFQRLGEWSCSDCGNTDLFLLSNIWSELQNSLLALQYVPEASSVCQNGYNWEIMLQFYYSLLVGWPGNMVKMLWDLRVFFKAF